MSGASNGPSQAISTSAFSGAKMTEAIPESPRKIYLNGVELSQVHDISIDVSAYNRSNIKISMAPKNVRITDKSIFIDVDGDQHRYTKKQLRDLIVKNLDNAEAVKWINRLKLNR